jgi:hypothetical protein
MPISPQATNIEVQNKKASIMYAYSKEDGNEKSQTSLIQQKPLISTHNSLLEIKADATADKVMRMPEQNFI